jgi:hypothetical protein
MFGRRLCCVVDNDAFYNRRVSIYRSAKTEGVK